VAAFRSARRPSRTPRPRSPPERERVGELAGVLQRDSPGLPRVRRGLLVGHERAAEPAPPRFHETGLLQRPDRLAQGQPAHAEQSRKLAFWREPVPRGYQAELDDGEHPLDRFLERIARPHRAEQSGEISSRHSLPAQVLT
jgi:hypothetical protein